jgi:hypothetical protein
MSKPKKTLEAVQAKAANVQFIDERSKEKLNKSSTKYERSRAQIIQDLQTNHKSQPATTRKQNVGLLMEIMTQKN